MDPDANLLLQVARSAPLAALILQDSEDGLTVLIASDTTAELSGLDADEITGAPFTEVFPGSHISSWDTELRRTLPGLSDSTTIVVDGLMKTPAAETDESRSMWRVSWTRLDEERWAVFATDLTVQYRYSELLEDALKAKNQAFESIAGVVHELRQPVASILGFVQLARELDLSTELEDFLATVAEQGKVLDRLIDDLLTSGLSTSGRLRVDSSVVTGPNLMAHLERLARSFPNRHIEVSGSLDSSVIADRRRLLQVLRGLIQNATKYGGPNIEVKLSEDDGRAFIDVIDDGEGLATSEVDSVFEPFTSGSAGQSSNVASTGIGLGVSRSLIADMGGLLEYLPGHEGATFRVTLPMTGVPESSGPIDVDSERSGLLTELTSYSTDPARRRLNRMSFRQQPSTIVEQVIHPVMYDVGRLWQRGDITVAQEHHASSVVHAWLMSSFARFQPTRDEVIVCAAAPGNEHENGLTSLAVALAEKGFRVVYIGRSVPVDALVMAVEDNHADALLLSLTTVRDLEGLRSTARALTAHMASGLLLGYGGRLFFDGLDPSDLPGVFLGTDPINAIRAMDAVKEPA